MKESKFQTQVLDYLEKRGAWVFTSHGGSMYQVAGLPDVIGVYKGFFLGIELKTGDYKATELQKQKLNNIQEAGGVGMILTDNTKELEAVLKFIDVFKRVPNQTKYIVESGIIYE